jgi:hypothetical protein
MLFNWGDEFAEAAYGSLETKGRGQEHRPKAASWKHF